MKNQQNSVEKPDFRRNKKTLERFFCSKTETIIYQILSFIKVAKSNLVEKKTNFRFHHLYLYLLHRKLFGNFTSVFSFCQAKFVFLSISMCFLNAIRFCIAVCFKYCSNTVRCSFCDISMLSSKFWAPVDGIFLSWIVWIWSDNFFNVFLPFRLASCAGLKLKIFTVNVERQRQKNYRWNSAKIVPSRILLLFF